MSGVPRGVGGPLAGLVCLAASLPAAAQDGGAPLDARLALCATCHTPDGNSIIPDNPVLAAQSAKYLSQQLRDFKSGSRKSPVMSVIVTTVDEAEFDALAAFFAAQKPRPVAKAKAKLAARGKPMFEDGNEDTGVPACAGCHGDDGAGSSKYPRLAGQHPAYVLKQLQSYKSGERANDQRELMREVAQRMTEAEMRAVAEYVATLKGEGE